MPTPTPTPTRLEHLNRISRIAGVLFGYQFAFFLAGRLAGVLNRSALVVDRGPGGTGGVAARDFEAEVPAQVASALSETDPTSPTERARASWGWLPPLLFVIILLVGGMLRFINISQQSVWLDEALSTYLAAHSYSDILAFTAGSSVHPPLYFWMLHLWLLLGSSELIIRALSAIPSTLALLPMYLLGRRVGNTRVALLATTLMALSAFQIWYAQEARMYAWLVLAVGVAMYALVVAIDTGRVAAWCVFAAAMLVSLYLDNSALYILASLVSWFAVSGSRRASTWRPFVLSMAVIGGGYLLWIPTLLNQLRHAGALTAWIANAQGTDVTGVLSDFLVNRTNLDEPYEGVWALVPIIGVALLAVAFILPRRAPHFPLLALWLGMPLGLGTIAGALGHPVLIARQMITLQPALFLLLALAAETLWAPSPLAESASKATASWRAVSWRGWSQSWRVAVPLVVVIGIVGCDVQAVAQSWRVTAKEDWRTAAALVANEYHNGDIVVFNAYYTQMPFDYYLFQHPLPEGGVLERGYEMQESLVFSDLGAVSPAVGTGSDLAGYSRIWLVLSHVDPGPSGTGVPDWIQQHDTLAHTWEFVGVTVALYQSG